MPFPVAQFNTPDSAAASSVPGSSPPFSSILFNHSGLGQDICAQEAPDCFSDLYVDQIVESVTTSLDEYVLKPKNHPATGHPGRACPFENTTTTGYCTKGANPLTEKCVACGEAGRQSGPHWPTPAGI